MTVRDAMSAADIYQTRTVHSKALENVNFRFDVTKALNKFLEGDWGVVCTEDAVANDEALLRFERVIGSYYTSEGELWIVAESENGEQYTQITALFPEEY